MTSAAAVAAPATLPAPTRHPIRLDTLRTQWPVFVQGHDGQGDTLDSFLASKSWTLELDEARGVVRIWSARRAIHKDGAKVTTVPMSMCAWQAADDLEAT